MVKYARVKIDFVLYLQAYWRFQSNALLLIFNYRLNKKDILNNKPLAKNTVGYIDIYIYEKLSEEIEE